MVKTGPSKTEAVGLKSPKCIICSHLDKSSLVHFRLFSIFAVVKRSMSPLTKE